MNNELFTKGQTVIIKSFNKEGVIVNEPNKKGVATVSYDNINIKSNITDLEIIEKKEHKPIVIQSSYSTLKRNISTSYENTLDLHNYSITDGINKLIKYIDTCVASRFNIIRVVHGIGEGKMKTAVHNELKKNKNVSTYRLGLANEGDCGATIIFLK